MLKVNTDLFLDDKRIVEVEQELNTEIHVVHDANDIISYLIGISSTEKIVTHV